MLSIEEMGKIIYDCESSIRNDKNKEAIIMGDYLDVTQGYNPYHHSSIYIIKSENTDKVYIGSTTLSIEKRLKRHEKDFERNKKGSTLYVSSYDVLIHENYRIELLESVCCESEKELRKIEGSWQKKTNNRVNKLIAGRTQKERREDTNYKETRKPKDKKYREENREKINAIFLCSCGRTYSISNKKRHENSKKHKNAY